MKNSNVTGSLMIFRFPINIQIYIFTVYRIVINTGLRIVFPYLPIIARGLDVDVKKVSLIVSVSLITSILGSFLAPVVDRHGRKFGMDLGLVIFIIGSGMIFIYPKYSVFFTGLLIAYLGASIFTPSVLAYIGDEVKFANRGHSVAISETSWSLSFIVFVPLAGLLIEEHQWNTPFLILSLLAIVNLIFLQLFFKNKTFSCTTQKISLKNIGKAITHKPALAMLLTGFGLACGIGLINIMFGVWLEESFELKITSLGMASGIIGFAELTGALLSAFVSDRIGKKRSIAACLIMSLGLILLFPLFKSTFAHAMIWLSCFYILTEYSIVSIMALSTEVIPWARTTFIAVFTATLTVGMGCGSFIGPFIYTHGFQALIILCGGLLLIAWLALSKTEITSQ